jgi:UrcA family protein
MKTSIRFPLFTRSAGLALLIGGALPSAAVFAAPPSDVPSVTVRFADLNLKSPEGVSVLYKRIHSAASQVCSGGEDRDLEALSIHRACAAKAQAQAIAQLHIQALSAYAQMKLGRPAQLIAMNDGK